jgi:hypothetical protein
VLVCLTCDLDDGWISRQMLAGHVLFDLCFVCILQLDLESRASWPALSYQIIIEQVK